MVDLLRRALLISGLVQLVTKAKPMNNYEKVIGKPRPQCKDCYLAAEIDRGKYQELGLTKKFDWFLCFAMPPARRHGYVFVQDRDMCPQHQDFVSAKEKKEKDQ